MRPFTPVAAWLAYALVLPLYEPLRHAPGGGGLLLAFAAAAALCRGGRRRGGWRSRRKRRRARKETTSEILSWTRWSARGDGHPGDETAG
ncbi:MAG: hypothetical protein ACLTYN_13650 [Dysosmobacter welbionis]